MAVEVLMTYVTLTLTEKSEYVPAYPTAQHHLSHDGAGLLEGWCTVCGTVKYNITVIPYDINIGAVFETSSLHSPTCCMLVYAPRFSIDVEWLPSSKESQHFLVPKISSPLFSQWQFFWRLIHTGHQNSCCLAVFCCTVSEFHNYL